MTAKFPGQPAGSLELLTDPVDQFMIDARLYAADRFAEAGRDLNEELPAFEDGLLAARVYARHGGYQRHEMPVIEEEDIPDLRKMLRRKGVPSHIGIIKAFNARPTQGQIYVDKAVAGTAKFGREKTIEFLQGNALVTDIDGRIFDGHHRWLTACTLAPDFRLYQLKIEATVEEVLTDILAFSDARHERNA
jgi:hypothetical protein